jgi:CelD/BcsL family acetyltransferase involved in cellulose biosynthesis
MFTYQRGDDRVLAPVGAGITDYLDWLIDPCTAEDCVSAIMQELQTCRWDLMELPDLPSQSPLLKPLAADCEPCDTCPILRIAQESFSDVVRSKQRRNLRTAQNRISRNGSWHTETANTETLPEYLSTLIRLHTSRWNELREPGVLADPKVQQFHQRAAPRLLGSGLLRFYGLRFEGRLIAVLHTLVDKNAVYCYMQGFDPAYVEFSPGMLILEAVIRDAVREGRTAVDFLRGREKYKYGWGAQDQPTFRIRIRKSAPVDIAAPQAA